MDADIQKIDIIASFTDGFSGAYLANLVNEAALRATRTNKTSISLDDLEWAKDKVLMGPEQRSRAISKEEKKLIAYHEAGHALVAVSLPENETDPLHKVTIIARGMSGGSTWQLPLEDKGVQNKKYLENQLVILMAGRAAEEIAIGECTTGAQNDIRVATDLARQMICNWGMSTSLGRINLGTDSAQQLGGLFPDFPKNYSEQTAQLIDREMKRMIDSAYEKAAKIIWDKKNYLDKIAEALITRETLSANDVKELLKESGPLN